MPIDIVQVDAFTSEPFSGNPAAVCVLDETIPDERMQLIAREMNLSETAFVHPPQEGDEGEGRRLRWFTPKAEVDLCGHATLASAHVLWTEGHTDADEILFRSNSGPLTCTRDADADAGVDASAGGGADAEGEAGAGWISMDFPSVPPWECSVPEGLDEAIGDRIDWMGTNQLDLMAVFNDPSIVRKLEPEMRVIEDLPYRGLIVTAPVKEDAEHDFVSRFFAPRLGVDEDPVTGSAHTALGPYWANRTGKDVVVGYQASERGGYVRCRPRGDRVDLMGQAVTVLEGALLVD